MPCRTPSTASQPRSLSRSSHCKPLYSGSRSLPHPVVSKTLLNACIPSMPACGSRPTWSPVKLLKIATTLGTPLRHSNSVGLERSPVIWVLRMFSHVLLMDTHEGVRSHIIHRQRNGSHKKACAKAESPETSWLRRDSSLLGPTAGPGASR